MIIGIDGTALTIKEPCGVKTYAYNLIKNFVIVDKNNSYIVFVTENSKVFPKAKNIIYKLISPNIPFLKRQIVLPLMVKKYRLDVMHYLEPGMSLLSPKKNSITTIHDTDLNYIYPAYTKFVFIKIYNKFTRWITYHKSKQLIAVSLFTKNNLLKKPQLRSKDYKISVVHHGVRTIFKPSKKRGKKFILAVGDGSPRKNIKRVISAYCKLPSSIKHNYKLKIVMSNNLSGDNLVLSNLSKNDKKYIKLIYNASESEMVTHYRTAFCLVFPSTYEDFGLPIIEAMSCGCPVITSKYTACAETAAKAAFLIDPYSEMSIKNAIYQIVIDRQFRKLLITNGLKRAREFTWEKTAIKTIKVYEYTISQKTN